MNNNVCKRITLAIMIASLVVGLTTCKKEKIDAPTVKLFEGAITIESNKAIVSAEVTDQGGAEVKSRGFVYGISGGGLDTVYCGSGTGIYSAELTNLQPNTTYFYEAFAQNMGGIGTSGKVTFTSKPLPSFMITVSASPTEGGLVSGGGSVQQGQYCTVMATANEGHSFTNWTENNNVVSTDASYTFIVDSDRTLNANFAVQLSNDYTIDVSANPIDGGAVTGGGSYEIGTQCTATAEANVGYTFVNWTENGNQVSSEPTYTFPVTVSRSLVANFTKQAYVIYAEVEPENSGTVTGAGGYNYGEECTLTAIPNTGYDFVKWTKGGTTVSTNASFTFPVTETATYKAHFKIKNYTIGVSADPTNGGTVTGGGTYEHGQSCTVEATPAEGYAFANWTDDGEVVSEEASYTFTVTGNRTLVAHFTELQSNEYSITVSANTTEGGTVTGGGVYHEGESCTVTAEAKQGFTFINWTENGNQVHDLAEYTFPVTGNRVLVANFEAQAPTEYIISVSAYPSNGGTVEGGGTYQQGDQCSVVATANEGYTFINWTEDGEVASTNSRYTFIVNSDRTLVANFQVQSHTISVSAEPANGGSVSGGGPYNHGQSCTVNATTNDGYTFTNWTENGSQVSTNANYTFTVTGNRTLVAHFAQQSQAPTGAINGVFSVSAGQQVYFSQGNLQYKASNNTWRFATNQYDYIGDANSNISSSYSGWIDLFGWGTSGWNCGNTYYRPWDSNNSDGSLYGPPGQYNLTGNYANSDWGYYNAISNGGNQSHQWRTLTSSEWNHVFYTRSTTSGIRYAKAQVNNVNGVILLPDNWSSSYYTLYSTNDSNASFGSNVISSSTWANSLEAHGAVFLPAAGYRSGTSVSNVGGDGDYWSSGSFHNSNYAYRVYFSDGSLYTSDPNGRYIGQSVRLVCPAQ